MIHNSAGHDGPGLDTEAIRRWHKDGMKWSDIGYHYVIERVGEHYAIVDGRWLHRPGSHTRGHNDTIGICLVGDFDRDEPPQEQFDLAAKFVASLALVFGFGPDQVWMHRDLNDTTCPGKKFSSVEFHDAVGREIVRFRTGAA